jgi:phosphoglycerol transferase
MAKALSAPILITMRSPTSPLSLAELKMRALISAIPCSCRGPITPSPAWSPQCGIPLFAPFEGNASASVSSFFPQNICLGDILKNSGYENYFVQGANLRFAGKDVFLKSHGFDHLYGAEELKTTVADPAYRNDWGFYDDTVLEETWKKFEELSQSGKRFSLFALTVDTHHPDGFISRTCERKRYDVDGKKNLSSAPLAAARNISPR